MTKPRPPRVLEVDEGYYVAGTHDVELAIDLLIKEAKILVPITAYYPFTPPLSDLLPPAEHQEWLDTARVEYAHTGPTTDSDYAWMIYTHKKPGRGRYKLVWWPW